jgi:hypothetical protein
VGDPVDLTASFDGSLYVGRDLSGSGGIPDDPTRIHRIAPDKSVSTHGSPVDDPDTVLFDPAGDLGSVGAVLVGGSVATGGLPTQAQITQITTSQANFLVYGPDPAVLNPSGMAFEASGDLVFTDFNLQEIFRLSSGALSSVASEGVGILDIAVNPFNGNLYASLGGGAVRIYSPSGTVVTSQIATGRALAFDPLTWPPDLYTVNNTNGDLTRTEPDGTTTTVGQGFTTVYGMDFGIQGHLFLTEFDNDRVLRVSVPRTGVPALSPAGVAALVGLMMASAFLWVKRAGGRFR